MRKTHPAIKNITFTPTGEVAKALAEIRAAQKGKILAAIASRGWHTTEIYPLAAQELVKEGRIQMGEIYATGGNRKLVWVPA